MLLKYEPKILYGIGFWSHTISCNKIKTFPLQSKSEVQLNIDFVTADSPAGPKAIITAIDQGPILQNSFDATVVAVNYG